MAQPPRHDAAERLGTPEHLDRVLYVTTAREWLALCVLMILMTAVVVWAIWGEVSTYVRAEGIILGRGGMVFDATSPGDGRLSRIIPAVGATVEKGEVVAEITDAETMERYAGALAAAEERRQVLQDRESEAREENRLAARNMVRERARLKELEGAGQDLLETARKRMQGNQDLFRKSLVARTVVEDGERAVDLARRNLFDIMRRRDELNAGERRRRNEINARIAEVKAEYTQARRRANEIAALIETWRIRAPVSGRVTESKAQVGATLEAGESVLSIETGGDGLDVLIYVSPADGKRVESGMPALVSPATVRREEFGSMIGTIESLSKFPASLDGMIAVLRNRDLARTFSSSGPPYPGRVALTPDASTASGFAWTSPQAANVDITPGTLARVEIKVASQPPLTLVVPWVKERLDP